MTCEGQSWQAGDLTCAALNISKERVGAIADGAGETSGFPWVSIFPGDARGCADDLVAFRVYIRFFLTKCRPLTASEGDALDEFNFRLPNMEKVLYRPESPRRTLLPAGKNGFVITFVTAEAGDECVVVPAVEAPTFGDLLLLDFMLALHFRGAPRQCASCGVYFRPIHPVESYCRDCRAGGERQRSRSRDAMSDPAAAALKRATGRVYTRKSRGKITEEESNIILQRCHQRHGDYMAGHITLDAFIEELAKL